jgi:hypothetical protein
LLGGIPENIQRRWYAIHANVKEVFAENPPPQMISAQFSCQLVGDLSVALPVRVDVAIAVKHQVQKR